MAASGSKAHLLASSRSSPGSVAFSALWPWNPSPCVENTVPADPGTSGNVRLPKKNRELSPQDYIPRIAVVSGDYDQIECVLKRIGIDELDMYNGRAVGSRNPPAIAELGALLADETKLLSYNIVVVNCTDNQYQGLLATPQVKKNLEKFVRSGGATVRDRLGLRRHRAGAGVCSVPVLRAAVPARPGHVSGCP
jgi:hypothetical protein